MGQSDQPLGLALSEELGPLPPERAAFEAWLNPGRHAGNVSAWVGPGRYESDRRQMAWLGWKAGATAQRERMRAQAARDAVEVRWAMREQIAAWLDGQGLPGYATEVRCRDWA